MRTICTIALLVLLCASDAAQSQYRKEFLTTHGVGWTPSYGSYIHIEGADKIGQNRNTTYTDSDGSFAAKKLIPSGVNVVFQHDQLPITWSLSFSTGSNEQLTSGFYDDASVLTNLENHPGLEVYESESEGAPRCSMIAGSFRVLHFSYFGLGGVNSLRATFTQYCDGSQDALTGEVRFNY